MRMNRRKQPAAWCAVLRKPILKYLTYIASFHSSSFVWKNKEIKQIVVTWDLTMISVFFLLLCQDVGEGRQRLTIRDPPNKHDATFSTTHQSKRLKTSYSKQQKTTIIPGVMPLSKVGKCSFSFKTYTTMHSLGICIVKCYIKLYMYYTYIGAYEEKPEARG